MKRRDFLRLDTRRMEKARISRLAMTWTSQERRKLSFIYKDFVVAWKDQNTENTSNHEGNRRFNRIELHQTTHSQFDIHRPEPV